MNYLNFLIILFFISCSTNEKKSINNSLLVDLQGNEFSLNSYKGNVIILNIWATWCKPCIAEFESLEDLFDDYAICGSDLSSPLRKTIILSSKDDPCIPIDPLLEINANELLDITITENGGHCGFLENFAFKSSLEDWMMSKLYG